MKKDFLFFFFQIFKFFRKLRTCPLQQKTCAWVFIVQQYELSVNKLNCAFFRDSTSNNFFLCFANILTYLSHCSFTLKIYLVLYDVYLVNCNFTAFYYNFHVTASFLIIFLTSRVVLEWKEFSLSPKKLTCCYKKWPLNEPHWSGAALYRLIYIYEIFKQLFTAVTTVHKKVKAFNENSQQWDQNLDGWCHEMVVDKEMTHYEWHL